MIGFEVLLGAAAVLAGATAAVSGFGIGSLLTPILAARVGATAAVAAVALPHAVATAIRCWRLRRHVDWSVLARFGVPSALGGLAGALFYARLGGRSLAVILGLMLIVTAVAGVTGVMTRLHPRGAAVWLLGLASGGFGGVVGNQGGLRSGALMAFGLAPLAFVATATATGLVVDAVRTPIYLWRSGDTIAAMWRPIVVATAGVVAGTLFGERLLFGLSPARFRQIISLLIGALGIWLLIQALSYGGAGLSRPAGGLKPASPAAPALSSGGAGLSRPASGLKPGPPAAPALSYGGAGLSRPAGGLKPASPAAQALSYGGAGFSRPAGAAAVSVDNRSGGRRPCRWPA